MSDPNQLYQYTPCIHIGAQTKSHDYISQTRPNFEIYIYTQMAPLLFLFFSSLTAIMSFPCPKLLTAKKHSADAFFTANAFQQDAKSNIQQKVHWFVIM